jgi:hypothetical protein
MLNKKSKIYATGNETLEGKFNLSYYIFEKDTKFLDWLGKLLVEVFEVENGENIAKFIQISEGEESEQTIYIKDINKMVDIKETYANKKGDRVDLFYGLKRVYVTLRKSFDVKGKFAEFIIKSKEWIKIEETERVPVYVKYAKKVKS